MSIKSNPSDTSLMVISYCHDDEMWRDRLVKAIQSRESSFEIFDDRIVGARVVGQLSVSTHEALEQAKVLVVILSQSYFSSSWLVLDETPAVLAPILSRGLWIMPVVIHDGPWQEIALFRKVKVSTYEHSPLTTISQREQDKFLDDFAVSAIGLMSGPSESKTSSESSTSTESERKSSSSTDAMEALSRFSFSTEVQAAIRKGRALATTSQSSKRLTTSCLLFGLAEGGRDDADFVKTPEFLFRQLTANGEEVYRNEFISKFPLQDYPSKGKLVYLNSIISQTTSVSPDTIKVFELAEQISKHTYHPHSLAYEMEQVQDSSTDDVEGRIHARHLLAALLTAPEGYGVLKRLSRIVTDIKKLRLEFFEFIKPITPDDDHEAWQQILIEGEVVNTQHEQNTQNVQPAEMPDDIKQPLVAGFMADSWEGRDLLSITPDVNALASLVAAFKVEPPLAIGLFGEWGSGKSHFMRQLKSRVEKLSRAARQSKLPQNQLGYYKNIVQIEFNAWHYIEGNLWASLVDHIFANLRISEKEKQSFVNARRDELMKQLGVKKGIVDEKKDLLKAKEDGIRARVARVNDRKESVYQDLERLKDDLEVGVLNNLNIPISFSESDKKRLASIGIKTTSLLKASDVHETYQKSRGLWQKLKGQLRIIRSQPRRRLALLLMLLIALLSVVGLLLRNWVQLSFAQALFGSTATAVIAGLAAMKPYYDEFRKSWTVLEKKDEAIQNERQQQIAQLENEIQELTKQALEAEREAEYLKKQADKLEEEIESVTASKLIAQFIEDRAAATDYRRHLGLLALIRRDFEKLRDLFREQREAEDKGSEDTSTNKINRIVLYIDDLDRCPPERVVQVLQAIHLLLAFPLFVVVVGVDSRWVTRALQESYEWLRDDDEVVETGSNGKPAGTRTDGDQLEDGATPHDYLEKIFQIPFWLRPMNATSCIEFLDGLTLDIDTTTSAPKDEKTVIVVKPQTPVATETPALVEQTDPTIQAEAAEPSKLTDSQLSLNSAAFVQPTPPAQQKTEVAPGVAETQTENEPSDDAEDLKEVDISPRSLKFERVEVDYMKELAPLIGRSPRAVKRFLNCYRLVKVGLTEKQFELFLGQNGEGHGYKAAMILLGIITGAPKVSSAAIEILDDWPEHKERTVKNFLDELFANQEISSHPDGIKLRDFLFRHLEKVGSREVLLEMLNCASRVSRFSFRVVSNEPLGKRTHASAKTKAKPRQTSTVA